MEHKGTVYFFTGLSGAGKTTVGSLFYQRLKNTKPNAVYLDGDEIRVAFGEDVGLSLIHISWHLFPAAAPGKAGMPSTTGVRSGSGPSAQWNSSWSGWRPGTAGRKPRRCGHSWSTCFQLYGRRSCPAKYRPCSAAKQPRTYK